MSQQLKNFTKKVISWIDKHVLPILKYLWGGLFYLNFFHGSYLFADQEISKHLRSKTWIHIWAAFSALGLTLLSQIILFVAEFTFAFFLNKKRYDEYLVRERNRLPANANNQKISRWKIAEKWCEPIFRYVLLGLFPVMSAALGTDKHVGASLNLVISGATAVIFLLMAFGIKSDHGFADSINAVLLGMLVRTKKGGLKAGLAAFLPLTLRVVPNIWTKVVTWAKPPNVPNPNNLQDLENQNPNPVVLPPDLMFNYHKIRNGLLLIYIGLLTLGAGLVGGLCSNKHCDQYKRFPTRFLMFLGFWLGDEPKK